MSVTHLTILDRRFTWLEDDLTTQLHISTIARRHDSQLCPEHRADRQCRPLAYVVEVAEFERGHRGRV